jgi:hypothetical protein
MATALGWQWIPLVYRSLFYEWILIVGVGGGAVLFLFVAAIFFRVVRGHPEPPGGKT